MTQTQKAPYSEVLPALDQPLNVYRKIAEARVMLQEAGLKKTGENTYSHFKYFQLEDFLPTVNKFFQRLGLCSQFSISDGNAFLTIYNTDKPDEEVTFISPIAEAGIKGASAIQQLGGIHTYMRRYLWLMAMEITEADAVDALPADRKEEGTAIQPEVLASPALLDELKRLYTSAELATMLKRRGYGSLSDVPANVGADWVAHRMGVNSTVETF